MARFNPSSLSSGYHSTTLLNNNFNSASVLFDRMLDRYGTDNGVDGNSMQSNLDMNSHKITNVAAPTNNSDVARWVDVTNGVQLTGTAIPSQTGNSGKFITTNGSTLSWGTQAIGGLYNVKSYGAAGDGSTDDTAAIQSAIAAIGGGRGAVYFPSGVYKITSTLSLPSLTGEADAQTGVRFIGENMFSTSIVNYSTTGNPAIIVDKAHFYCAEIGFWSRASVANDCIHFTDGGNHSTFFHCIVCPESGHSFKIHNVHTILIEGCIDGIADMVGFPPSGATGGGTQGATSAFIYMDIPSNGNYVNALTVRNCTAEGMPYKVYTNQGGTGTTLNINIEDNQFEGGSSGGIYIKGCNALKITGNYIGEGSSGFPIELNDCHSFVIESNFASVGDFTLKNSMFKLQDCSFGRILSQSNTIWSVSGNSNIILNGNCQRIFDQNSGQASFSGQVVTSDLNVSTNDQQYSIERGKPTVDINDISSDFFIYPYIPQGTIIKKRNPAASASPGWLCTTASAAGSLVQTVGAGPDPTILTDYYCSTAYDYRIVCVVGGVSETATFKVDWSAHGAGTYAALATEQATKTIPLAIKSNGGTGGPLLSFSIIWPSGQTYVAGDTWTLTGVTAPVFRTLPAVS